MYGWLSQSLAKIHLNRCILIEYKEDTMITEKFNWFEEFALSLKLAPIAG